MGGMFGKSFDWGVESESDASIMEDLRRTREERERVSQEQVDIQRGITLQTESTGGSSGSSGGAPTEDSPQESVTDVHAENAEPPDEEPAQDPPETEAEQQNPSDDVSVSLRRAPAVSESSEQVRVPSDEPKPAQTKTPQRSAANRRQRGNTVQIRDFPASIANHIQGMFPGCPAMGKALAAYILAVSDIDLTGADDIPQDVRDLSRGLKNREKNASVNDLYARLANLDAQSGKNAQTLRELELAVAYIIFDRSGFRQETAPSPRDVDMLEDGMMDLVDRIRQQGKQSKNEDMLRHGRAIR